MVTDNLFGSVFLQLPVVSWKEALTLSAGSTLIYWTRNKKELKVVANPTYLWR